ncbi:MAG TPA: 6-bladed beta-propeller [Longimicrobiales bacterium]
MNRLPLPRSMHRIALIIFLLTGCGSSAADVERIEGAGPAFVPLDSVRLSVNDSFYIGKPLNIDVDDYDGSFYITDTFLKRMVRFDRNGDPRKVYGRPGGGPGEFTSTVSGFVLNDSTVAVTDTRRSLIHLFDRQTGAFRDARRFEAVPSFTVPFIRNDTVWMGGFVVSRRTAVVAWDLRSDSILHFGPLPLEYRRSLAGTGQYMGFLPYPVMTGWGGRPRVRHVGERPGFPDGPRRPGA